MRTSCLTRTTNSATAELRDGRTPRRPKTATAKLRNGQTSATQHQTAQTKIAVRDVVCAVCHCAFPPSGRRVVWRSRVLAVAVLRVLISLVSRERRTLRLGDHS